MATLLALTLCVLSKKWFVVFYVFSFPPVVYVGTLNIIASIPGPSILTLSKARPASTNLDKYDEHNRQNKQIDIKHQNKATYF